MAGTSAPPLADDFDAFFRKEFGGLVAVAYGLTGRRMLAEELAQEAMLIVHRRWESLAAYEDIAAFARRVVANRSVSAFRRLLAEARALNRVRQRPERSVHLEARDEELWREVRRLPSRQAQAITLRYVADLSAADIGAVLGISEGNVRVVLHRARHALATALTDDQEGERR